MKTIKPIIIALMCFCTTSCYVYDYESVGYGTTHPTYRTSVINCDPYYSSYRGYRGTTARYHKPASCYDGYKPRHSYNYKHYNKTYKH
jgi:hypothetical protein